MEYFSLHELQLPRDVWAPFERMGISTRYDAGQLIYLQDSTANSIYYLRSGRVKSFISSEDGTEKLLTVYQAGSLFGEASFFDELPRVSSAMTMTECEISVISRSQVWQALAENPELTQALLKYLARTVRMLSAHVDNMTFLQADQRIARFLLTLPCSEDGTVRCTQDEIASAVSASRVTASRIVNRFSREGILRTGYGTIRILDRAALEEKMGG